MSFFDKRKQRKLYQQWVDKSGLPQENVPSELGPERVEDEEPWAEERVDELPRSGRVFVVQVTQRQLVIVLLVIAVLLIISACLATALIMQSC